MRILVADDRKDNGEEIVESIRAGYPAAAIDTIWDVELRDLLENLFARVDAAFQRPGDWTPGGKLPFDDADIVILDNNLAHLKIKGARLTAESIAGYVRAFTHAPYVVSLNKNPVDFDLRYLVGGYQTNADLALNTVHLSNKGLWSGRVEDARDGFLPWYWPRLLDVAQRRRAQIDFVRDRYAERVFSALGIPDSAYEYLSLHAKGALSPVAETDDVDVEDGKKIDAITFSDVFSGRGERSIPGAEERELLSSHAAVANPEIRQVLARVVAGDIDLWFRRDVLGPQEALVDVPHLIARMPFLAGPGKKTTSDWNNLLAATGVPYGFEKRIHEEHLARTRFSLDVWVPSPSFWWSELKNDEKLNALFTSGDVNDWPDAVFCEDRSIFMDRSHHSVMEFSAEFEGAWGRRHVARVAGMRYAPLSRFAV